MTPSFRRVCAAITIASSIALAACGGSDGKSSTSSGGGSGGSIDAKQLFVQSCAGCHSMKAAGSNGTMGPSMDDLAPSKESVLRQIKMGGGGMPADLLKGAEAEAVAAWVAENAG
jgi:cytochrome c551